MQRLVVSGAATAALAIGIATGIASAHAGHGHPAKIHDGTCERLGAAAFTLDGVGANENQQGEPIPTPETVNPTTSYQIMVGHSSVDASLASLLQSPHAIMLYDSDETMQGVACGDLGGAEHDDELVVGLAEMNVPGHTGIAILKNAGAATDVTIYVGHGLAPIRGDGTMPSMDMPGMSMSSATLPTSPRGIDGPPALTGGA